jgi:hypothetical protein
MSGIDTKEPHLMCFPGHWFGECAADVLCPRKKQSKEQDGMPGKAKRPAPKPENSCARKWSTYGKASTARARPNRRSPSDFQRHGGRECPCLRLKKAGLPREPGSKLSGISPKAKAGKDKRSPRRSGRVQSAARLRRRAGARLRHRPFRGKPAAPRSNGRNEGL